MANLNIYRGVKLTKELAEKLKAAAALEMLKMSTGQHGGSTRPALIGNNLPPPATLYFLSARGGRYRLTDSVKRVWGAERGRRRIQK